MTTEQPGHELLMRAVDAIAPSTTLDATLLALVEVLQAPLELWHANVSVMYEEPPRARIVGSWSRTDSVFSPGTVIALEHLRALPRVMAAFKRGDFFLVENAKSDSLVDHLMRQQGVGAGVAIPLHSDEKGILVLLLGGSSLEPLLPLGASFWRGLAAGIGDRFKELVGSYST